MIFGVLAPFFYCTLILNIARKRPPKHVTKAKKRAVGHKFGHTFGHVLIVPTSSLAEQTVRYCKTVTHSGLAAILNRFP